MSHGLLISIPGLIFIWPVFIFLYFQMKNMEIFSTFYFIQGPSNGYNGCTYLAQDLY
jgi:hypothetical protein